MDNLKKAQALIAILGEKGEAILNKLPKDKVEILKSSSDGAIPTDQEVLSAFLQETLSVIQPDDEESPSEDNETEEQNIFDDEPVFNDDPNGLSEDESGEESVNATFETFDTEIKPAIKKNDQNADIIQASAQIKNEKNYVVSFLLANLDPEKQQVLLNHLPEQTKKKIKNSKVINNQMTPQIFEVISSKLFKSKN